MGSIPVPNLTSLAPGSTSSQNSFVSPSSSGYRPWVNGAKPALTMAAKVGGNTTIYVFDNIQHIEHELDTTITLNPVQTGAAINDHAFLLPLKVTAEILMSDVCQSYTVGQFAGSPSRSVNAYQTLMTVWSNLAPIAITTRLAIPGLAPYAQMLIVNIRAEETVETVHGLRAWVTFQQIITAGVELVTSGLVNAPSYNNSTDSTRPQATGSTQLGNTPTQPVPSSVQQQNNIQNAPASANLDNVPDVSGSGDWGSYPVSSGGFEGATAFGSGG
jgi:hypothetical protein